MPNAPLILEKNYLNGDDDITSSHGGTLSYLYDGDKLSYFQSSGANSDATNVVVEIVFREGSNLIDRSLDTVIMLDHNIKRVLFEYWNGSAYVTWFEWTDLSTTPAGASTDLVMGPDVMDSNGFAKPTTAKVKVTFKTTQTANLEKKLSGLFLTHSLIEPDGMTSYQLKPRVKARTLTFGDNSIQQVVTKWSPNRSQKYEASVGFSQMSESVWQEFLTLKESGRAFIWYPEPEDAVRDIYNVVWTNPLNKKYSSIYKAAGIDITLELKEI